MSADSTAAWYYPTRAMGGEAYPVVFSSLLGFLLFPVGFGKGVPESSDSIVQNLKIKDGFPGAGGWLAVGVTGP